MNFPQTARVASRLDVATESSSTNADLRLRAADAAAWPHLSVLLTANQTAGRGRLGRSWVTPPGSALAISVLLRDLPSSVTARGWIPLAAGVAMADAVAAQLNGNRVGAKWPNDVLVDGRKICGILAEATDDAIIVGAGVNISMSADELPVPTATSFAALGVTADGDALVAGFLRGLESLVAGLVAADDAELSGLHAAAIDRSVTLGQDVEASLPDGTVLRGRAVRLERDGRLVVNVAGAEHSLAAGDVIHARLS